MKKSRASAVRSATDEFSITGSFAVLEIVSCIAIVVIEGMNRPCDYLGLQTVCVVAFVIRPQ